MEVRAGVTALRRGDAEGEEQARGAGGAEKCEGPLLAGSETKELLISHCVSARTGDDRHKLKCRKFHLCMRENYFTVRVVSYGNRLAGEGRSPSSGTFSAP